MIMAKARGFTVIELMLFLAVTGALFVALMFGVNASVFQQRYRQSVTSLSTVLQGEYSEVLNTRNDSANDWKCTDTGTVDPASQSGDFRGTSPCVLLGKAIQIKDGNVIDIYNVIGCDPTAGFDSNGVGSGTANTCGNINANAIEDTNDFDTLKAYNPKITDFGKDEQTLEWNSTLATTAGTHTPLQATILILRSPSSGLLRVFVAPNTLPDDLKTMLSATDTSTQQPLTMCVEGDSIISAKESVTVNPSIAGSSGVTINQADIKSC